MVSVLMGPVLSTVATLIRTAQQQHAAHVSAISVKTQPVAQMMNVRQETVLMESVHVMSVSLGKPVQTMAAHQSVSPTRTALLTNGATPLKVSASLAAEQVMTAQKNPAVSVLTTSVLTQSVAPMLTVQLGTALLMEHVWESATKTLTVQQLHAVTAITMPALTQPVAPMKSVSLGKPVQTMAVHQSVSLTRTALLTNGVTPLKVSASLAAGQVMTARQQPAVSVLTTSVLTQSVALMMTVQMAPASLMEHVKHGSV